MALIRLSKSCVGAEEAQALARVIDAGYLGMGAEVQAFENELSAYVGGREVLCVATGTAALHLAISCLDIGAGDEVLVPSITYVASFQAVSATGATPVACDNRPRDVFIDLADAERKLTARTRAIMPVHYASSATGLDEVYAFARANGVRVIEDAAHAFGCTRNGKRVGAEGDVVCFSFDGIKNITSGEGGAITSGDPNLIRRLKDARLLGVEKDSEKRFEGKRSWNFDVHHQGFRYHMSNLMAAVGREQLKKLGDFGARRRALAARYRAELSQLADITLLDLDWDHIIPHIFVVRVAPEKRTALAERLGGMEIESGFHYQPNHMLSYFARGDACPQAEQLARELLSLPIHPDVSDADQARVIAAIKDILAEI